jgi:hypothetical protein
MVEEYDSWSFQYCPSGDDAEGYCVCGEGGSKSSLLAPNGEGGSMGGAVPVSMMQNLRHRMQPWVASPNVLPPSPPTKSSAS